MRRLVFFISLIIFRTLNIQSIQDISTPVDVNLLNIEIISTVST